MTLTIGIVISAEEFLQNPLLICLIDFESYLNSPTITHNELTFLFQQANRQEGKRASIRSLYMLILILSNSIVYV